LNTGIQLWSSLNITLKFVFSQSLFLGVGFNHAWFLGRNTLTGKNTFFAVNTLTGTLDISRVIQLGTASLQSNISACIDQLSNTIYVVLGNTLILFDVGFQVSGDPTSGIYGFQYLVNANVPNSTNKPCAIYDQNSMVYVGVTGQKTQIYNVDLYAGGVTWGDVSSNLLKTSTNAPSVAIDKTVYIPGTGEYYVCSVGQVRTVVPLGQITNVNSFSGYGVFAIDEDGNAITYDGNLFPTINIDPLKSTGFINNGYIIQEDVSVLVTFPNIPSGAGRMFDITTGKYLKNIPSTWKPLGSNGYIVHLFPDMVLILENNTLRGVLVESNSYTVPKKRLFKY